MTEVATRVTGIGQAVRDHRTALDFGLGVLRAAAHRVVHGGADLTEICRLTPATIAAITACTPLAPELALTATPMLARVALHWIETFTLQPEAAFALANAFGLQREFD